jgi:hypothetical protein
VCPTANLGFAVEVLWSAANLKFAVEIVVLAVNLSELRFAAELCALQRN